MIGRICDPDQHIWPAFDLIGQNGITVTDIEARALRLWSVAPRVQSGFPLYTCFFETTDWVILDTSPEIASGRALNHNGLFLENQIDYKTVYSVFIQPGTPMLPVILPIMTGYAGFLAFVLPPGSTYGDDVQSEESFQCLNGQLAKRIRRRFSITVPKIGSPPPKKEIKERQNATTSSSSSSSEVLKATTTPGPHSMGGSAFHPLKKEEPLIELVRNTRAGIDRWNEDSLIRLQFAMQPPIETFNEVSLKLDLPPVVKPNCDIEDWFFYLNNISKLISAKTGVPLTACIPEENIKSSAEKMKENQMFKSDWDAMEFHEETSPGLLVLNSPDMESTIPPQYKRRILWYKSANEPIPKGLGDYLKSKCNRRFGILQLGVNAITPDGKRARHLNALIIDHEEKIIERFEPHGTERRALDYFNYVDDLLPFVIKRFPYPINTYKLKPLTEGCPSLSIGPQAFSAEGRELLVQGERGGYCVCWSMMYVNLRLLNPTWRPSQIRRQMNRIGRTNITPFLPPITSLIWSNPMIEFSQFFVDFRDYKHRMTVYIQQFHGFVMDFLNSKHKWHEIFKRKEHDQRRAVLQQLLLKTNSTPPSSSSTSITKEKTGGYGYRPGYPYPPPTYLLHPQQGFLRERDNRPTTFIKQQQRYYNFAPCSIRRPFP